MSEPNRVEIRRTLTKNDRGLLIKDFLNTLTESRTEDATLDNIIRNMKLHAFNLPAVVPFLLDDYLIPFGLVEVSNGIFVLTNEGETLYETIRSKSSGSDVIEVIESKDKKSQNLSEIGSSLKELLVELQEIFRPRLFFDIKPIRTNMLDLILRNSGNAPAFDITCKFEPDLPYAKESISKLAVFKSLPFLEQGQMIKYTYDSLLVIINKDDFPKKTKVTISYRDSKNRQFEESYEVDLLRYVGLLTADEGGLHEIHKDLQEIKRILDNIQRYGIQIGNINDRIPRI